MVLAGGAGRRMGGAAKPLLPVGGVPMLRRVLDAVADARPLIVVGPPELAGELPEGAVLTREDPPGGGPVAAVAAGAASLPPDGLVLLVASDLPFLTPAAVAALAAGLSGPAAEGHAVEGHAVERHAVEGHANEGRATGSDRPADGPDVALFVDDDGRAQHLCAMWRIGALRAALPERPHGASMRAVLDGVDVARVRWTGAGPPPWYDCDTPDELRRAESVDGAPPGPGGAEPARTDRTPPSRGGARPTEELS
ncbi:NTP transferase domain-containing protein [Catellatospora sp. NPDC049609]|uniref:molybdenum cofactor guanylyltransferase n=1 Tax=Catellatospora sp. NPDC049609 TaxID=3155505 RepID=UPI003430037B